jgi:hypothetical protein
VVRRERGRKVAKTKQRVPKGHPKKLKLEVGKRYVRRDGVITGPVVLSFFPFRDPISGETYGVGGEWSMSEEEFGRDIVAEYVPARSKKAKQGKPGRGRG